MRVSIYNNTDLLILDTEHPTLRRDAPLLISNSFGNMQHEAQFILLLDHLKFLLFVTKGYRLPIFLLEIRLIHI